MTGSPARALVVLDTGQPVGWSAGRTYAKDGSSGRGYTPLKFADGVSVVPVPAGIDLGAIKLSALPSEGYSDLYVAGIPWPGENADDPRLWQTPGLWPLGADADGMHPPSPRPGLGRCPEGRPAELSHRYQRVEPTPRERRTRARSRQRTGEGRHRRTHPNRQPALTPPIGTPLPAMLRSAEWRFAFVTGGYILEVTREYSTTVAKSRGTA